MTQSPKRPAIAPATWRFLFKAQSALASAGEAEAMCEAAVRLPVPRLADGCTLALGDAAPNRVWRAGLVGHQDALAVPLAADGRPVGVLRFHRTGGLQRFGRRAAAIRLYARAVGQALRRPAGQDDGFPAAVAHELRNALSPLRYGAAVIDRCGPESADGWAAWGRVGRQVGRLAEVLDGMVELHRADSGRLALRHGPVDLRAVAGRAVEAVGPAAREQEVRLAVRVAPEVGTVVADGGRLEQVLVNLLANAVRHTGAGGVVLVAAGRGPDGGVVVRVRDHGASIRPEFLPRVFDRFAQAAPGTAGLGLGLALVKRLVELHGGTVAAHSDGPGRGSEFTVRLPPPAGPEGCAC